MRPADVAGQHSLAGGCASGTHFEGVWLPLADQPSQPFTFYDANGLPDRGPPEGQQLIGWQL
ncbi:hypothetical protein ACLF6K_00015 [Streptomyces xanthophaeus]|uniref:hypothetical protein n=1 Tax=Streptomyces xanthophaeus TaxID=67385 RepID=UPI00398FBF7E